MIKAILLALILSTGAALAEDKSSDAYWQQMVANQARQIVELAKALDAANAKIAEQQKTLDAKAEKPKEPAHAK